MLDRSDLRRVLVTAGTTVVLVAAPGLGLAAAPPAAAAGPAAPAGVAAPARPAMPAGVPASPVPSLPPASVPGAPQPSSRPAAGPSAAPHAIGGALLAGRGVIVRYPSSSVPRLPGVRASAFVVADADTGQVLAARDPHGWYRPASTLKVLTAITLIPLLNPNATVVASSQATSTVPNVAGLVTGRAYKISDLFTALLTISANDAAIALTQAAGSFSKGMALINAEARHLQADDTVAIDPNGLDARGQHTSAYDLALIARQAVQLPAFLRYDQTITARFVVARHKAETLFNQNTLLTNYPGALGGKIGWTSAAGATYIGMARRHGVTLIVTLLHCPALTEIGSAEKLLNWGFAVDGKVTPVGTLVGPRQPHATPHPASHATRPAAGPVTARATQAAARSNPAARPSVLAAVGFTGIAVLAAGLVIAYNRRQRSRRAREAGGPGA